MGKKKKKIINPRRLLKQIFLSVGAYVFPIVLAFIISAGTQWMVGKDDMQELFSKFVFSDILFAVLSSIFITWFLYANNKGRIESLNHCCAIIATVLVVIFVLIFVCLFIVAVAEGLEIQYALSRKEKILPFVFGMEIISCLNSCVMNCFCHSEQYLV